MEFKLDWPEAKEPREVIETTGQADYVLFTHAQMKQAVAHLREQLETLEMQANEWMEMHAKPLADFAAQRINGQKTKSLKTGLGTLAFRRIGGGFKLADKEAALEFAKANKLPCYTETEVLKTEIKLDAKEYVKDPKRPGIEPVPLVDSFSINGTTLLQIPVETPEDVAAGVEAENPFAEDEPEKQEKNRGTGEGNE